MSKSKNNPPKRVESPASPAKEAALDPLELVSRNEEREKIRTKEKGVPVHCFVIDPGDLYRTVVPILRSAGQFPGSSTEALNVALKPRDSVKPDLLPERAAILEKARLWFTALLHKAVNGGKMDLQITRDPNWKL